MSKKSKILVAAFVASLFSINVSAQEVQSDTISGGQISLRKENGQPTNTHIAHKAPAKETLPSVYYDSYSRSLTFSSSVSMNIMYNVRDEDSVLVCQGTINLLEEQDTTIPIPAGVEGECTITLVINDQTYWGRFYVQSF